MDYTGCAEEELMKLAVDRKLVADGNQLTEERLVGVLMHAHQTRTFKRFMDLPSELRKSVYKFYFMGFNQHVSCVSRPPERPEIVTCALTAPTQPPLARTCRQTTQRSAALVLSGVHFWH